ncbi:hypothetical protein DFJ63DRAFT_312865 [Scheffersomyces coipomensis]|uniref:uncharacterized protein n=1 Tax=Scheffersomyces coipomensis TaxID=1788519 RepID=UPI00315D58DA
MNPKSIHLIITLCFLSVSNGSILDTVFGRFAFQDGNVRILDDDELIFFPVLIPDDIKQQVPPASWFKKWQDLEYDTVKHQIPGIRAAAYAYNRASCTWLHLIPSYVKYTKPALESVLDFWTTGEVDDEYLEYTRNKYEPYMNSKP